MTERPFLSKSTFIRGVQCEKSFYLHKKRPFLRDRLSAEQLAKFNRGHNVGIFARELFPGGVDMSPKSHFQMGASIKKTAQHIQSSVPVLYEAAFEYAGVRVALDILYRNKDSWNAVEVKSSAAITETFLWDVSLQYFVITNSGLSLDDFFLAYINYGYIRDGDIDMSKLFIIESVLDLVKSKQDAVREKIEKLREVNNLSKSPPIPVGPHCRNPYPCDFIGHCWKHIPPETRIDPSCFNIETAQMCGSLEESVGVFSSLYFGPAIPPYNGSSPYQELPFSYAHVSYSGNDRTPRFFHAKPGEPFSFLEIKLLIQELDGYKNILVFDKESELDRLRTHVHEDKQMNHQLDLLADKMLDLQLPFVDNQELVMQQKPPKHAEDALTILNGSKTRASGIFTSRLDVAVWYDKLSKDMESKEWEGEIPELNHFQADCLSDMRLLCQAFKEL